MHDAFRFLWLDPPSARGCHLRAGDRCCGRGDRWALHAGADHRLLSLPCLSGGGCWVRRSAGPGQQPVRAPARRVPGRVPVHRAIPFVGDDAGGHGRSFLYLAVGLVSAAAIEGSPGVGARPASRRTSPGCAGSRTAPSHAEQPATADRGDRDVPQPGQERGDQAGPGGCERTDRQLRAAAGADLLANLIRRRRRSQGSGRRALQRAVNLAPAAPSDHAVRLGNACEGAASHGRGDRHRGERTGDQRAQIRLSGLPTGYDPDPAQRATERRSHDHRSG